MLSLLWYLRDPLSYLRNQRGLEAMEYILMSGIVAAAAVLVYAALGTGLVASVTKLTTFIQGQIP